MFYITSFEIVKNLSFLLNYSIMEYINLDRIVRRKIYVISIVRIKIMLSSFEILIK